MARRSPLTLACLAAAGLLALGACSSPQAPSAAAPAAQHQMPGMDMGAMPGMSHGSGGVELWAVQSGPLGTVVTDGSGHVLHRFDKDSAAPPTSTCTGACATTWQPFLLPDGQQPELMGVDAAKVGTVKRADGGTQLTLAGWPLYTWSRDDGLLSTAEGQGTDSTWYAIAPDGTKAVKAIS
ncbi:hypothetical protein GCM10009836_17450 [Pseudonocardia ailaonensis]|uniref:Lipoprotein with Yx(FWY)xxD motif n=1 Tax=Pseudonocardia ailaonensis TaxID=367279 RepID=A0ABN2MXI2_9PSEU